MSAATRPALVGGDRASAPSSRFSALVRDHNQGRRVLASGLRGVRAARRTGAASASSTRRASSGRRRGWPFITASGRLAIGEASVAIAAASPHRADAFAACRYAIERIKQIVPIWKHEYFEGGDVWIEGATADPDDEAARERR